MEISGLYFGMRLVTLCRVLVLMFVDVHERIIVVIFSKTECIMKGRSKVVRTISVKRLDEASRVRVRGVMRVPN